MALTTATEMRNALIALGCVCTAIESDWRDGSAKFVVCDGPVGPMHSRRIGADGALTVTRLS